MPGEGPADAKAMLVGINPGKEEDKTGRPFVGPAGRFLNAVLAKNGINRNSIFVTNIVKHRTPGNRVPLKDEVGACRDYILEELRLLKPIIVVLMGRPAWKEIPFMRDTECLKTFHPAAAMRFPTIRKKFEADFVLFNSLIEQKRVETRH